MSSSESPCTTNCELDTSTQYCVKCGRSTEQIQNWSSYPSETRKQIMKEVKSKRRTKNGLGTDN